MEDYIEEKEIDILGLVREIWNRKRTVAIITACFTVLGLIAALAMERKFTTKIAFVPQYNSSMSSKLSSLASLAGVSLDDGSADGPISPVVYPVIMDNLDLMKELAHTPIHFKGYTDPIELNDWFNKKEYHKKNAFKTIAKYTVGLPGLIKGAINKPRSKDSGETVSSGSVPSLTEEEITTIKILKSCIKMAVIKNEKHVALTVTMPESVASAELAEAAFSIFRKYISDFKVRKAKSNLEYLEQQYANAKADYEAKQEAYARFKDRNQGKKSATAEVEIQRLGTEVDLARMLYLELAKNCLSARVKVTEDNVAFTELTPAYVPDKSSNSKKTVLLIWMLAGIAAGCAYALVKASIEKNKENETDTAD